MKMRNLLLAGILSIGLTSSMVTSAFATGFGSELTIDAKATTVNVTVPGTAAMIFNEDGTNTVPSSFTVTNNSKIAGVSLTQIDLDASTSGWKLLADSVDLKTQAKDVKNIRLKMGKDGVMKTIAPSSSTESETGSATFTSGEISIPATQSETIKFEVERGAFTSAIPASKAFGMTLNFEFN